MSRGRAAGALIGLVALLGCMPCGAQGEVRDPLLAGILARLAAPSVVRADFSQEKKLVALARPVSSSGHMVFSRKDGVIWQIEAPIRMGVALSDERITTVDAQGRASSRSLSGPGAQAQIGNILRALFSGDARGVERYFELRASGTARQWTIDLVPRFEEVSQVLNSLRLSGGEHLETLRVEEFGGDATLVRFRNIRFADALSAGERSLLVGQ